MQPPPTVPISSVKSINTENRNFPFFDQQNKKYLGSAEEIYQKYYCDKKKAETPQHALPPFAPKTKFITYNYFGQINDQFGIIKK